MTRPAKQETHKLRVLLVNRPEAAVMPGGDTTHILYLQAGLQKLGVQADVVYDNYPDPSGYDIINVFNLLLPVIAMKQVRTLRARTHAPIVLTPLYWNLSESLWGEMAVTQAVATAQSPAQLVAVLEQIATGAIHAGRFSKQGPNRPYATYNTEMQTALDDVDYLVTNSQREHDLLAIDLHVDHLPWTTILTGVDLPETPASPEPFVARYGVRDFILATGRVEGRKNQLMLLLALRDTEWPIVVAGAQPDQDYLELCKKYAPINTHFVGRLDASMLASARAAARVHAVPSWWECPGISNMEAALDGCTVVMGDHGAEREYFGENAYYCDPADLKSIQQAVSYTYENYAADAERRAQLQTHLRANNNWDIIATQTLQTYLAIWSEHLRPASGKWQSRRNRREVARAWDLSYQNKIDEAMQHLGTTVPSLAGDAPAIKSLGHLLIILGYPEQALDLLQTIAPTHSADADFLRLITLAKLTNKPIAPEVQLGPKPPFAQDDIEALNLMAQVAMAGKRWSNAVVLLNSFLETQPLDFSALSMMAQCWQQLGDKTQALNYQQRAQAVAQRAQKPMQKSPASPRAASAPVTTPQASGVTKQTGFNVIGFISGNLGLGILARNLIRVLLEKEQPVATLDLDPALGRGRYDHTFDRYAVRFPDELKYNINLFVVNPPTLVRLLQGTPSFLNGQFMNVTLPMWELTVLPPAWIEAIKPMDAIVAQSRFIQETFASHLPNIPMVFAAPSLYLPDGVRPKRKRFGLPEDALIFVTSFEPHSDVQRKNPLAIAEAFLQAFSADERAHLVIKLNNPRLDNRLHPFVQQFQERYGSHPRIHLLTEKLSYAEVLSLYASCDVFVSLHRAEGLGLGLMEAMMLGKPVIATAWSGNMTFMNSANSCPVGYRLIPVAGSIPAYQKDFLGVEATWADPSIDEAANWMRCLADDPVLRSKIGQKAAEDMQRFQEEARQGRFIEELQTIWEQHVSRQGGLTTPPVVPREASEQPNVIQRAGDNNWTVDIVIPVFGQPQFLKLCVESVLATTRDAHLILVDDSSPGVEIEALFDAWQDQQHLTLARTVTNLGFLGTCKAGVELGKAPYILFLNSDTQALESGWLEKLLPAEDDIAIVGAKLLHPPSTPGPMAGKIQHAGVASNDEGIPYHPFLGWDADSPQVNQSREVNAITGACFLIRRQVWVELGGWDARFGRGVYEDVDLCWQARQKGYRVLYQPAACLYHHSGASEAVGGRHLLYGQNKTDNLKKLLAKWQGMKSDEDIFFGKETVQRWRRARKQINQATGLLDKRQFSQAFNLIQKAVKTAPDLPEVLIGYAQLLAAQGKHLQAAEQIVKALEVAPAHWDARLRLVDEWIAADNLEKAAEEFLHLQAVFPNDASIQQRAAKLTGYLKKPAQVKPELKTTPVQTFKIKPSPKATQTLERLLKADDLPAALKEKEALLDEELLALVRRNAASARTDGNSDLAEGLDDLAAYIAEVIAARPSSPEPTSQSTKTSPAAPGQLPAAPGQSPVAPEQPPVAPRPAETLRMLLEADDLAAALKQHEDKLDTSLLDLVRQNAETARADGITDLAQGLDNLAEIIAEVIEQRKETSPKQVHPQAVDDQTLGVVLKRAQKQKSTKRRKRTKKNSRKT